MKVTGFSFIRNAVQYDYPIVEAITSILPICDEFVVAVGNSNDETLALIKAIDSPKIKIIETVWDDNLREGGSVLAAETNKALAAISVDTDWAFYMQGDEVVHEKYLPAIRQTMERWANAPEVEGLLFNYLHFYGSYDYTADSRHWYRREIRIVRPHIGVFSYKDAQGFRKSPNQKLRVKLIEACIYHYGWVKHPDTQNKRLKTFYSLWNDTSTQDKESGFDYSNIDSLGHFEGTHPSVIIPRITRKNWEFSHDISKKKYNLRVWLLTQIEKLTGWRIGEYKNYKII